MAAPVPAEITLPGTFLADIAYRVGAVLFSGVGVIGFGVAVSHHRTQDLIVLSIPFVFFFAVLLLVMTFQLTVDETGLHQRSILGRKEAAWAQVERLDQGRAYSVHGGGTAELVWLSLVSTKAQEAIALEIIRRCALRPSGAKMEYPVKRQWVR